MNANFKTTKLSLIGIAFGVFFFTGEKAEAFQNNIGGEQYNTQVSMQNEPLIVKIKAKKGKSKKKKHKKDKNSQEINN